jgi:hypothetical protein
MILGAWALVSPWVLGFASAPREAAWTTSVLGAAIVVFAGVAAYIPRAWEEVIIILLGVALLVSPWALGFVTQSVATTNAVIVGVLVAAFGIWAILADPAHRE